MRALTSEFGRWLVLSSVVVAFGVVGILRVPHTDAATVGEVAGFGFRLDGSECYITVNYTVDQSPFRFRSPSDSQWCDYEPLYRQQGSIVLHYDSTDPSRSTLTPRGSTPIVLVVSGLVAALALCFGRMRRRNGRRPEATVEHTL